MQKNEGGIMIMKEIKIMALTQKQAEKLSKALVVCNIRVQLYETKGTTYHDKYSILFEIDESQIQS